MKHRKIYDEEFDDPDQIEENEAEIAGYSIIDAENGVVISPKEDKEDEPTIASIIPQNEQIVIIDDAKISTLEIGERLQLIFGDGGIIEHNGEQVGCLKGAFVEKLKQSRENEYAECFLYSHSPSMVKLVFYAQKGENRTKII